MATGSERPLSPCTHSISFVAAAGQAAALARGRKHVRGPECCAAGALRAARGAGVPARLRRGGARCAAAAYGD